MMITRTDIYAAMVGVVIVSSYAIYSASLKAERPATDFFEVKNLNVPDFIEGAIDVPIVYEREIKEPFPGSWVVEVHSTSPGLDFVTCSGSGERNYKPKSPLPPPGPSLSWFIGETGWAECQKKLTAGQYYLAPSWEMRPEGYPVKHYSATSNIFIVLPKGSQSYVTPEQVEQLERAEELLNDPIPLIEGTPP